jgi:hypothetical protein
MTMDESRILLELAAATAAILAMLRLGEHHRLIARRERGNCASCGRKLPSRCLCRETR